MTANAGILTYLLGAFLSVFSHGYSAILPSAQHLLFLMAGIEMTLAGLYWALRGENLFVPLIQKSLVIGTFAYFVLNWPSVISAVLGGFIFVGQHAGSGGGGGTIVNLTNPSGIISQGFVAIAPITNTIHSLGTFAVGQKFMLGWAELLTLLAFFILGIQCFLTYLEFYIIAVLALILVPFGVFKHTAFLAEKSLGVIISHGVKLMVLAFIISAAAPVLGSLAAVLPASGVTIDQAFSIMLGAGAIAFLAWHAPGIAGGMMSGGPSLHAGTAASTGIAAGLGTMLGWNAAKGAAQQGLSATKAAVRGVGTAGTALARTAGGVTQAAQLGAATAMTDSGAAGRIAGAARGVGAYAMSPAQAVVTSIRNGVADAFNTGKLNAYRGTGGKTAAEVNRTPPTPPAGGSTSPQATTPAKPKPSAASQMSMAHMAQSAVPPTATGGAGISVPLNTP